MMKLNAIAIATLALLSSFAAQAQSGSKVYIVQLKEEPAASYQGTTAGYAATQAAPERRSDHALPRPSPTAAICGASS